MNVPEVLRKGSRVQVDLSTFRRPKGGKESKQKKKKKREY